MPESGASEAPGRNLTPMSSNVMLNDDRDDTKAPCGTAGPRSRCPTPQEIALPFRPSTNRQDLPDRPITPRRPRLRPSGQLGLSRAQSQAVPIGGGDFG